MSVDTFSVAGVVVERERKRIQLVDQDGYQLYLHDLPPGLCLEISVTPEGAPVGPRTQQIRYWFGVVLPPLAQHFGMTLRQMSRDLLGEFGGYERNAFDKWIPKVASLSWLSAEDMSAVLDWVRDWARNVHGIEIPAPEKRA